MTTGSPMEISLRDPLSDVARKERRMLLGISVLSIFIAKTGLIPTKISALGIDLEKTNQNAFLVVMALIVLYFVAAFLIYGLADFLAWRVSYNRSARQRHEEIFNELHRRMSSNDVSINTVKYVPSRSSIWTGNIALPVSLLRSLFEFLLPIVVGAYAICALASVIEYAT